MAWALVSKGGYTPMIKVTVDGDEVSGDFYSLLIKATVRDEAGQDSDKLTIDLDDRQNQIVAPREKALIEAWMGFIETGLVKIGSYEMQAFSRKWGDEGETATIQASAADLKKLLKGSGREHFDENTTFGQVVERIAKRWKLTPSVDAELAKIKTGYRARVGSSDMDFLTTLADDLDAIAKPMGKKLVALPRGKATSAGGQALGPIKINKSDTCDGEITPNARAQYGKIKTSYIDQKSGKRVIETAETGLDGPDFEVRDPLPSKELAKKKGQAEARRLTRNTADGHVTLSLGHPEAQAEADVELAEGFASDVMGTYRADAVEHTFDENGFRTKIEIKAKEDGSGGPNLAGQAARRD